MLTDTAVRRLRPKDRPFKVSDQHGLYLLVQPNGARYWRMDYRFAGKRCTLALGVYPEVSLRDAILIRLGPRARYWSQGSAEAGRAVRVRTLGGKLPEPAEGTRFIDLEVRAVVLAQRKEAGVTGILNKFHVEHGIHGARVIARSHQLTADCMADGEIDNAVQMLKDDLDACAKEMKRLVALNGRGSLFEGWPSSKDRTLGA